MVWGRCGWKKTTLLKICVFCLGGFLQKANHSENNWYYLKREMLPGKERMICMMNVDEDQSERNILTTKFWEDRTLEKHSRKSRKIQEQSMKYQGKAPERPPISLCALFGGNPLRVASTDAPSGEASHHAAIVSCLQSHAFQGRLRWFLFVFFRYDSIRYPNKHR